MIDLGVNAGKAFVGEGLSRFAPGAGSLYVSDTEGGGEGGGSVSLFFLCLDRFGPFGRLSESVELLSVQFADNLCSLTLSHSPLLPLSPGLPQAILHHNDLLHPPETKAPPPPLPQSFLEASSSSSE